MTTPAPYFLGEKVEAAIEAAMAAHEPLKNDSVCTCGVKNNMDGDVLFGHRVSVVIDAMRTALNIAEDDGSVPIGPFTVMLCEECDTDREVDTFSAEGVATFRVCGHVETFKG